jgi:hypothetical protein
MEIPDDVCPGRPVRDRVYDENVRDLLQDLGSELTPSPGGDESMLRSEDNFEMLFELTGQVSDDVHAMPKSMS